MKFPPLSGNAFSQGSADILRRLIAYAEKVFGFSGVVVPGVADRRLQPRIPTSVVFKSVTVLFWARMGSLNALELTAGSRFFRCRLGQSVCSADTIGRVNALMDAEGLRQGIHYIYDRLKRNKALRIIAGSASLLSMAMRVTPAICSTVRVALNALSAERTESRIAHSSTTGRSLLCCCPPPGLAANPFVCCWMLSRSEPEKTKVATALRLLARVIASYPRAFDLVLADAPYATAPFFNFLLAHGKHALTVLKDDRRSLYQDARALFATVAPKAGSRRNRTWLWWDFPDLLTWPQVNVPVRVIRSLETHSVKRQLNGEDESRTSDWIWATTLPLQSVSTERAVGFGHQRWDIENHGFNELVRGWHADHIYRHDPNAIECFLPTAFLACNIFHAFFTLNLKPEIRSGRTQFFWRSSMSAEIYAGINPALSP